MNSMTTIEVLTVPDCPNAPATIEMLRRCLDQLGLDIPIHQHIGNYPSPTVLIDGVDIMGSPATTTAACRLDLPTEQRILSTLNGGDRQSGARHRRW
jgi:hypothetical protein